MAECTEAERLWLDAAQSKDRFATLRLQVLAVASRVGESHPQLVTDAKAAERAAAESREAISGLFGALAEKGLIGEQLAQAYELLVFGKEPKDG